ncbi:hypothetical protein GGR53DRAFT_47763 [Hypoxylon sp. FL1150]|nr:hypothetical protein GGR53DRAFT_47763 [Hypoxylon sp. FL1150]
MYSSSSTTSSMEDAKTTSPVVALPPQHTSSPSRSPSTDTQPSANVFMRIFRAHRFFFATSGHAATVLDSWEPPHQTCFRVEQARIFTNLFSPIIPPARRNRNIQLFWEAVDSDPRPWWANMDSYVTLRAYYLSQAIILAKSYDAHQPLREILGYLICEWECVDGAAEHFVALSEHGRDTFMWYLANYMKGPYASSFSFTVRRMNCCQAFRDGSYDRRRQV